ncbi:hypothetical protein GBF38_011961 [Nibea albiflora]|uniref:Uncharacterized protein n=1 Tax=Nibea albiflora TaxID=240163 RepID=A0ACB7EIW0_NIBAL|nr:hypothetical protein GBF38_011961 [Nibea albiflora]
MNATHCNVDIFSLTTDKLDSSPPAAILEADQSSSEPAGGKDDDTAPAVTDDAPKEETAESSEQTSSAAMKILYCFLNFGVTPHCCSFSFPDERAVVDSLTVKVAFTTRGQ